MPPPESSNPITTTRTHGRQPSRIDASSATGRTTISGSIAHDGVLELTVSRDGHVIHNFSDNAEQGGPDAPPKHSPS